MERLTTYRPQLMAIAMIAILFTHLNFNYGSTIANRLELLSVGGVDAFFFLSGYGLYFSSLKKRSIWQFYKRRAIRILPAFYIILVLQLTVQHRLTLGEYLLEASTLTFWFPGFGLHFFGWFVSAIIMLYAIFPLFNRYFKRNPLKTTIIAVTASLIPTALYAWYFNCVKPGSYNGLILAFARFPIFFLGVYYAFWERKREGSDNHSALSTMVATAAATLVAFNIVIGQFGYMYLRNTGMLYLPFIFIIPGVSQVLCKLFRHMPKSCNKLLAILGTCTLESYLLIGPVYSFKWQIARMTSLPLEYSNYIMMLLCIIMALLIHHIIEKARSFIPHKSAVDLDGGRH